MSATSVPRVVEEMYRAAADPPNWPIALGAAARLIGGRSCTLAIAGIPAATGPAGHPGPYKDWLPIMAALAQDDATSIRHAGPGGIASYRLVGSAGGGAGLMVEAVGGAGFNPAACKTLRKLLPHLAGAIRSGGAPSADAMAVLNEAAFGVLVLDPDAGVRLANVRASAMLGAAGLWIEDGTLFARSPASTAALRRHIAAVAAGGRHAEALPRVNGHAALHLALLPLRPGRAVALLTVPGAEAQPDPASLQALLGLTPAQSRLAALLAAGLTLRDAAIRLGIAHSTAVTHVKQTYARAGVSSQAALIRLVLTCPLALLPGAGAEANPAPPAGYAS